MTPKEELRQLKGLKQEILELQFKLEEKKSEAEKITPTMSDGGGTCGISDKVGNGVIGLIMLKDQINKSIDRACLLESEILKNIDKIKDSNCRRILRLRYVDDKDWKQIAILIGYSLDWIYALHGRALKEYGNVK